MATRRPAADPDRADSLDYRQVREAAPSYALILEAIADRTDVSLAYLDRDFNFVWANTTYAAKCGHTREELIGRNHFDLFANEENQAIFEQVRDSGEEFGIRAKSFVYPEHPEWGTTYWDWTLAPVKSESGCVEGLVLSLVDVTEQKLTQQALRESNQRLALLSDTAGKLLVSDDPQELVQTLCERVMDHLGCQAFLNYLTDHDRERLHLNAYSGISKVTARSIEWLDYGTAVCGRVVRSGCRVDAERIQESTDKSFDLIRSLGMKAYACHPLLSRGGRVIGALSFGTRNRNEFTEDDLSLMKIVADQVASAIEKTRLLSAERRRAAELQSLLSSLADGVALLNADGDVVFMNDAGRRILGVNAWQPVDGLMRLCELRSIDGEPLAAADAGSTRALQGETVRDLRHRVITPDGRDVAISISASPVCDASGQVVGATNVFRDVTEVLQFEQKRRELYEREHRIAEVLQQALVPLQLPSTVWGCPIAAIYEPALNEAEVGGDFFDILDLGEGRFGVLIGDVAGKGLSAAMRVGAARHAVRSQAFLEASPARVLALANEVLVRDTSVDDSLLTAFFAVIDVQCGTMTYANGGHEPPVLCTQGEMIDLEVTGPALGIDFNLHFEDITSSLRPGDRLVAVTDGVTEARADSAVLFGRKGLCESVSRATNATVGELTRHIVGAARDFARGRLQDDAAVVVVEFRAPRP